MNGWFGYSNQIRSQLNEIGIYGGSKSVDNFAFRRKWNADAAYIISDPSDKGFKEEDIGIVVLSDKRPKNRLFFNKDVLRIRTS